MYSSNFGDFQTFGEGRINSPLEGSPTLLLAWGGVYMDSRAERTSLFNCSNVQQ
ncbi:MAG: hypothetical protein WD028_10260 [Balneolaceae bacterium]